jgi:hypothetical protein
MESGMSLKRDKYVLSTKGAMSALAWGIVPGIQSHRKQALKAGFNENQSGPKSESRFQRWAFGFHESWGAAPRLRDEWCAFGAKKRICAPHLLMQAMRDQASCAFQKLAIFIAECVQLITLHVQHAENMPVLIPHRNNDL